MTPEQLAAVADAVDSVADRMSPEDRWDLRQEIALKLIELETPPENLAAFARECARNRVYNLKRDEVARRELERVYGANRSSPPYFHDSDWEPTWYPPCPGAKEFAPFACSGARVMTVKETRSYQDVELALVGFINFASR